MYWVLSAYHVVFDEGSGSSGWVVLWDRRPDVMQCVRNRREASFYQRPKANSVSPSHYCHCMACKSTEQGCLSRLQDFKLLAFDMPLLESYPLELLETSSSYSVHEQLRDRGTLRPSYAGLSLYMHDPNTPMTLIGYQNGWRGRTWDSRLPAHALVCSSMPAYPSRPGETKPFHLNAKFTFDSAPCPLSNFRYGSRGNSCTWCGLWRLPIGRLCKQALVRELCHLSVVMESPSNDYSLRRR